MNRIAPLLLIAGFVLGGCAESKVARWVDEQHAQARRDARSMTERVQRYAPPLHDPQRIAREYGDFARPQIREVVEGVKTDVAHTYHAPGEASRAFMTELSTVEPFLNHSVVNVRDWVGEQAIDAHELLIGPVR